MRDKIFSTIKQYDLIKSGDAVIVALSGGADSMALLHFFAMHKNELGIRLEAAHFEHGLRGESSVADAAFAAAQCRALRVPLVICHGGLAAGGAPGGVSEEEWARKARYAFLERLAEERGAKVATAHTASDDAETVLFHAIRGAGTRGLAGIRPVRGRIVRPMLAVSRREVEAYCAANDVAFVTDLTNLETDYARNRLRIEVLPVLEEIHPGAAGALARLAEDMRALDGWLEAEAAALLERAREEAEGLHPLLFRLGGSGHAAAVLLAAPEPVRRKALGLIAGPHTDRQALLGLEAVLRKEKKGQQLRKSEQARLYKGVLVIEPPELPGNRGFDLPLAAGNYQLPGGWCVEVRLAHAQNLPPPVEKSDKKLYTFTADYDRIWKNGVLRSRLPGDSIKLPGRGRKSLKKWLTEEGLPRTMRAQLPLLAQGSEVAWHMAAGVAEGFGPGPDTGRLVCIRAFTASEKNG